MYGINHAFKSDIAETAELNIFLGSNFMVSNHSYPLYNIEAVKQLVEDNGRPMICGADFLPLTLVAGIYGMNFETNARAIYSLGFFAVLGFMAMAILMVIWRFWASNWSALGRRQVGRLRLFAVELVIK